MVQEICPRVISSRASFFSYEKLGWIRTMFYSVRETWSHMIEMLRRYWLEVRFVFFTIFRSWLLLVVSYFFVFLAILLIIDCYPEKNKIWNSLSSLSSAMFLVRETWMQLVYKFLVSSFSYEFVVRETWTVCHQLNWVIHAAHFSSSHTTNSIPCEHCVGSFPSYVWCKRQVMLHCRQCQLYWLLLSLLNADRRQLTR